eukprot:CAMPEP_0168339608 /NCGR_PEP_ID=MMETSP0213-20121227/13560_1 /TAXON_ID=151035 /ORGANISM="Euplotes harpa, Strain FSP1.4" /LENGTH=62 /DNA_ID=CAMNT_0008345667 /DNA_START=72 /DNA_END=260 /DNA_ORIENTATION=-
MKNPAEQKARPTIDQVAPNGVEEVVKKKVQPLKSILKKATLKSERLDSQANESGSKQKSKSI